MKYLLFLLIPFIGFAQNDLIGNWKIEILGAPKTSEWSINADNTIDVTDSKTGESIEYSINETDQILSVGFAPTTTMDFYYELEGDTFSLYIVDVEQSPIYSSFTDSFDKMKGTNSVTDEAADKLKNVITDIFSEIVIIRGYKIK